MYVKMKFQVENSIHDVKWIPESKLRIACQIVISSKTVNYWLKREISSQNDILRVKIKFWVKMSINK